MSSLESKVNVTQAVERLLDLIELWQKDFNEGNVPTTHRSEYTRLFSEGDEFSLRGSVYLWRKKDNTLIKRNKMDDHYLHKLKLICLKYKIKFYHKIEDIPTSHSTEFKYFLSLPQFKSYAYYTLWYNWLLSKEELQDLVKDKYQTFLDNLEE